MIALHPGGASWYRSQLYGPFSASYAEIFGFIQDARSKFSVSCTCGANLSHSCSGKSRSAGASEIRVIGAKSSLSCCVASSRMLLSTLCVLAFAGFRMALIAFPNFCMSARPFGVCAAMPVDTSNSSVSAFKCAFLLRLGTWQCWGNNSADPEILYARVSGT